MSKELLDIIEQIEREKGIKKESPYRGSRVGVAQRGQEGN